MFRRMWEWASPMHVRVRPTYSERMVLWARRMKIFSLLPYIWWTMANHTLSQSRSIFFFFLRNNPDRFSSVVWLTSTDKKMSGSCLSSIYRAVRKWNDHHNVFSKAALFISGNNNSCNCFWLPLNFTELQIIDILSLVELQV